MVARASRELARADGIQTTVTRIQYSTVRAPEGRVPAPFRFLAKSTVAKIEKMFYTDQAPCKSKMNREARFSPTPGTSPVGKLASVAGRFSFRREW
jgi:hypothetical protein